MRNPPTLTEKLQKELPLEPMQAFSRLCWEYQDDGRYRLTKPFFYYATTGRTVIVPSGFMTDLDSVPRIPLVYAAFKGRTVYAAVVHDYLYRSQAGKGYADRTFLDAMKDEGVAAQWRYPIYLAVSLFGGSIYRSYGSKEA